MARRARTPIAPRMRIRSHLLLFGLVLGPSFLAASLAIVQLERSARDAAVQTLREAIRAPALLVDGQASQSIGALGSSDSLARGDLAAAAAMLPSDLDCGCLPMVERRCAHRSPFHERIAASKGGAAIGRVAGNIERRPASVRFSRDRALTSRVRGLSPQTLVGKGRFDGQDSARQRGAEGGLTEYPKRRRRYLSMA